jgi:hypothetical protein
VAASINSRRQTPNFPFPRYWFNFFLKISTRMNILKALLVTISCITMSSSFCAAQKITLIQKTYVYHNMGTGGSTSDWSHHFKVEGESVTRKAGYFGQHLKKYVQSDSNAVKYINSYATRQTFKLVTSVSTVVLFSTFAITNLASKTVESENVGGLGKNKGCLYASIGTLAVNVVLRAVKPKSIKKAVDSYNLKVEQKGLGFKKMTLDTKTIAGRNTVAVGMAFEF